jgi:hypothetical protein
MVRKGSSNGLIYRLIYYSRNILATTLCGDQLESAVNEIVTASRRHNEADHLTGCLMCSVSAFAGVLEGPREAVERTFDRISADPRHTDVMAVSLTPAERPQFPGLPLALAWRAQPGEPDPLQHLLAALGSGAHRATTGGDVLRLLQAAIERPMEPVNGTAECS